MKILRDVPDLSYLPPLKEQGSLVLVPTMGALHEGHLSLVKQGVALGPVVVSIFVNPTQFGPNEDFDSYPRDLASDLSLLEPLGVSAVFAPEVSLMYGREGEVTVQPGSRGMGLCGADRPGHFAGVLTVVAKLFGLLQPDIAIFGRKDAQQCLVIRQMVEDLKMPVRLIDGITVREPDGLAMSSRNRYLDPAQREQALCLSQALNHAEHLISQGERHTLILEQAMLDILGQADAAEYAEIRSVPDLEKSVTVNGMVVMAVAAKVGPARLIDNLVLNLEGKEVSPGFLLGT